MTAVEGRSGKADAMARTMKLFLILASAMAVSGCVAGMVASAAGMAMQSARGTPQSNEHLQPRAVAACSARAAPYGTVKIIDVVQQSVDKIVVWGTAGEGPQRRSFECGFKTAITYFKLREIPPR
jgi:hypothetical protein